MGRLISVIIPAYNEEDSLGELVKRLKKIMLQVSDYAFEVIVVENGSGDSTFEKLTAVNKEDRRFKILQFSRNCIY